MVKILGAIIGGTVTLLTAIMSHYFAKGRELRIKEAEYKLERYKNFLDSLAGIGSGASTYEDHKRFVNAVNTLNLTANKETLEAIYKFLDFIDSINGKEEYDLQEQRSILNEIILEIRRDLHPEAVEDFEQFEFTFCSHGLTPGEVVDKSEGWGSFGRTSN